LKSDFLSQLQQSLRFRREKNKKIHSVCTVFLSLADADNPLLEFANLKVQLVPVFQILILVIGFEELIEEEKVFHREIFPYQELLLR
jgi:hypothetical protein